MSSSKPVALVTGCSEGGIGHALALNLVKRGYQVFATARKESNMPGLAEAGCELLALDVTVEDSIKAALKEVESRAGGRLNLLINNAGTGAFNSPLLDVDLTQARKLYDVNVWGLIAATQAFAPLLVYTAHAKSGPRAANIINIGSITGIRAFPFRGIYGSSKAAVHAISDALRSELQNLGVKVTVAVTGGVSTQIGGKAMALRNENADATSVYAHVWKKINDMLVASRQRQDTHGMSPEDYAEKLLSKTLVPSSPAYYHLASYSTLFRILHHLPAWFVDRVAASQWHLKEVTYEPKKSV